MRVIRWAILASEVVTGCGRFAGVGCALLCFVVPSATGAPRQVVEVGFPKYRTHNAEVGAFVAGRRAGHKQRSRFVTIVTLTVTLCGWHRLWRALQGVEFTIPRQQSNRLKIRVSVVRFRPWPPLNLCLHDGGRGSPRARHRQAVLIHRIPAGVCNIEKFPAQAHAVCRDAERSRGALENPSQQDAGVT